MRTTLHIPHRFHPAHSLLGRWMRRHLEDERRAEALFIVTLSGFVLALLLTQYLTWALLHSVLASNASMSVAFWAGQIGTVALVVGTCVVGFKPAVTVTCEAQRLSIRQGDHVVTLSYDAIDEVRLLTARQYHRHWRRYAATHAFVNHLRDDLLLLRTEREPVVLGLSPDDREVLLAHLDVHRTPACSLHAAPAA